MSDECLMKQETVFSFYTQYQAVMRKFTLAGKTLAFGEMTGTVCGMLIFVDKSAVPLCTIFAMSCIIIDQF